MKDTTTSVGFDKFDVEKEREKLRKLERCRINSGRARTVASAKE